MELCNARALPSMGTREVMAPHFDFAGLFTTQIEYLLLLPLLVMCIRLSLAVLALWDTRN